MKTKQASLIVEDEPVNIDIPNNKFGQQCQVLVAKNGCQALYRLEHNDHYGYAATDDCLKNVVHCHYYS